MAKSQSVANKIRKIRRAKGMTFEDLTKRYQRERSKITFKDDLEFVKRAEAGEDITLNHAKALAKALGVKIDFLYPQEG